MGKQSVVAQSDELPLHRLPFLGIRFGIKIPQHEQVFR
jgi:hypothetical protein